MEFLFCSTLAFSTFTMGLLGGLGFCFPWWVVWFVFDIDIGIELLLLLLLAPRLLFSLSRYALELYFASSAFRFYFSFCLNFSCSFCRSSSSVSYASSTLLATEVSNIFLLPLGFFFPLARYSSYLMGLPILLVTLFDTMEKAEESVGCGVFPFGSPLANFLIEPSLSFILTTLFSIRWLEKLSGNK